MGEACCLPPPKGKRFRSERKGDTAEPDVGGMLGELATEMAAVDELLTEGRRGVGPRLS